MSARDKLVELACRLQEVTKVCPDRSETRCADRPVRPISPYTNKEDRQSR